MSLQNRNKQRQCSNKTLFIKADGEQYWAYDLQIVQPCRQKRIRERLTQGKMTACLRKEIIVIGFRYMERDWDFAPTTT